MRNDRIYGVRRRMGFTNSFNVSPEGTAGGMSLWWDDSVTVTVLRACPNVIDTMIVASHLNHSYRATWIYGTPYREDKAGFWLWLGDTLQPCNFPWFCGGDWNEILWNHEKKRRIGNSTILHGTIIGSDHCPLILDQTPCITKRMRLFKFEAAWVRVQNCRLIVERCWNEEAEGSNLHKWSTKIRRCRTKLREWSRSSQRNSKEQLESLNKELCTLQEEWNENREKVSQVKKQINELSMREEQYWQQRSRLKWLVAGDANTSFFHQTTIQMRRQNRITRIKDCHGHWISDEIGVRRTFEAYFKNIFSSNGSRDWGNAMDCVESVVTPQMNEDLLQPITLDDVKTAAFELGSLKAPGPDGFQGTFYQNYWSIIHEEIVGTAEDFLAGIVSPFSINETNIALIPKVYDPESVSQFRPISLCNFSYKILSKILANRLKPILPCIITPNQNAFVSDRQIQDNILVAHEVFHYLKLRKVTNFFEMGMKLDMNKAYDRVEWDFLEAVMKKMGFDDRWVNLVMGCVKTVTFAVMINGQPGRRFHPSRGIRQGDPISPYLFLLLARCYHL